MSIDNLLDRTWSSHYTCNEFLCEAWQQVVGENLTARLEKHLNHGDGFKWLDRPISPCIVFFSNNSKSSTHVGLFYGDKLLHLTPRGVQFIPLEIVAMNFREVRYYT